MNFYLLILIVSVIIASFAQILLKKSAEKTYASPICYLRVRHDVFVHVPYGFRVQRNGFFQCSGGGVPWVRGGDAAQLLFL